MGRGGGGGVGGEQCRLSEMLRTDADVAVAAGGFSV